MYKLSQALINNLRLRIVRNEDILGTNENRGQL